MLTADSRGTKTNARLSAHIAIRLRHKYRFGYVERKRMVREPRAAAACLSSYFVNGKGKKMSLEQSVQSTRSRA